MAAQRHAIKIGAALRRDDFIAHTFFLRLKPDEHAVLQVPERRITPGFFTAGYSVFAGIGREDIVP
ncbi:MAG: hypothetical protein FJX33_16405 [Alphaproteobacteria bacterium]|nr:hypothetical protein [Alphaproteobacteria bacterium]